MADYTFERADGKRTAPMTQENRAPPHVFEESFTMKITIEYCGV